MAATATSLPKRTVGGRFPVIAIAVRFDDGKELQGLGHTPAEAIRHAESRHSGWAGQPSHASDAGQDWYDKQWADFARSR